MTTTKTKQSAATKVKLIGTSTRKKGHKRRTVRAIKGWNSPENQKRMLMREVLPFVAAAIIGNQEAVNVTNLYAEREGMDTSVGIAKLTMLLTASIVEEAYPHVCRQ